MSFFFKRYVGLVSRHSKKKTSHSMLLILFFVATFILLQTDGSTLDHSRPNTDSPATQAELKDIINGDQTNNLITNEETFTTALSNTETSANQDSSDDSKKYPSYIKLIASSGTVYIGGSNPSDTTITVKAADDSSFNYISVDEYYSDLLISADSSYGPGDMPLKVHEISVAKTDPNSSGKHTIRISAYGENGIYSGYFDVIYSKSFYYLADNGSVTRTDNTDTIIYSYSINITEANLPKNSTVTINISPQYSGACTNKNSTTKYYVYKGPSRYTVDCVVARYVPPPPCTQTPCYVEPMRSEGTIRINISVFDSNSQYINNIGYSNFDFIVPEDYDM